MPEMIVYSENQIIFMKSLIVSLTTLSVLQFISLRRTVREFDRGRLRFESLKESTMYLLDLVEKNNIELTDFDIMALQTMLEPVS